MRCPLELEVCRVEQRLQPLERVRLRERDELAHAACRALPQRLGGAPLHVEVLARQRARAADDATQVLVGARRSVCASGGRVRGLPPLLLALLLVLLLSMLILLALRLCPLPSLQRVAQLLVGRSADADPLPIVLQHGDPLRIVARVPLHVEHQPVAIEVSNDAAVRTGLAVLAELVIHPNGRVMQPLPCSFVVVGQPEFLVAGMRDQLDAQHIA